MPRSRISLPKRTESLAMRSANCAGDIGGDLVSKAANDGYTFLMSSAGVSSINPQLYKSMSFDPAKDLTPVAAAARVLVFLETRATLPVSNFKEFIAHLKANPGKLSFGTPGNGSSPHLAAEMLKAMTGTYAIHVPYRGAAPAPTATSAGTWCPRRPTTATPS